MRSRWIGAFSTASLGLVACASTAVPEEAESARGDSAASVADIVEAPVALDPAIETVWAYLRERYDADEDGRISAAEYTRDAEQFAHWDVDGDGTLSAADFEDSSGDASASGRSRQARSRQGRGTLEPAPEVAQEGRLAPDFSLTSPDGETTYSLASFRGKKPVALIFGSYT